MKPIYDRYTFKTVLKNIKSTLDLQDQIDALSVAYGDSTGYEEPYITLPSMVDDVIALLEIAFDDDGVLFSWIYDRDFGRISSEYLSLPMGAENIKTDDDLYDYLVESYLYRYKN